MFASGSVDLEVAAIGAVAVIGAATIPAWLNARKTKHVVGTPNGNGTVIDMLEASLENQGEFRAEIAGIKTQLQFVSSVQEQHALEDAQHQRKTDRRFQVVFDHLGIPPEETS